MNKRLDFRLLLLLIISIPFFNSNCYDAFVVNKMDTSLKRQSFMKLVEPEKHSRIYNIKKSIHGFIFSHDDEFHVYDYVKKLWLAAILCFPDFGGLFGIGRFYLRYNWQGLLQLSATILTPFFYLLYMTYKTDLLSFFFIAFTSFWVVMVIWELVDFARILLGTLRPKYGGWG